MPPSDHDKQSQPLLEKLGIICVVVFFGGLLLNVLGIKWFLETGVLDPKTNLPYTGWEKMWLPVLMFFPLAIQIYIYIRLLSYSKSPSPIKRDTSLKPFLSA